MNKKYVLYAPVSYLIENPSELDEKSEINNRVTSLLFVIIGCSNLFFPQ